MQKVEDLVNDILLSGNKHEIDWLTKKNGYDKLMVDNVYQHLKKFDYHTSTGAEYRLAKQYLTYCGFRPGLLNHWTPPSINKAKPTKPSLVTKRNTIVAESSASSQPKPRPALFPTVSIVEPRKRRYVYSSTFAQEKNTKRETATQIPLKRQLATPWLGGQTIKPLFQLLKHLFRLLKHLF